MEDISTSSLAFISIEYYLGLCFTKYQGLNAKQGFNTKQRQSRLLLGKNHFTAFLNTCVLLGDDVMHPDDCREFLLDGDDSTEVRIYT